MIRQIGKALGIGVLVTATAYLLQVEPVKAQESHQRVQTRAGNALSNLESRSISKDAAVFFPESSQNTTPEYPDGNVGSRSQGESEFKLMDQEFQIKRGETSNSDENFDTFSRNEAQSDKVRVLMTIDEWNN